MKAERKQVTPDPPMDGVYAFGPFDRPRYKATNHHGGTAWCCPFDAPGHLTVRAAAQHLAQRMVLAWA